MRRSLVLALLVLVAFPAFTAAQQRRGTVFISGGALAAIEHLPSTTGYPGVDATTGGTVPGGMLAVGVHLTPRVSARAEWSMTDELTLDSGYVVYPLLAAAQPADLIAPGGPREHRRTTSGYALLGYHVTSRRAALEVLGGLGLVNTDARYEYDVRILARAIFPSPMPEPRSSTFQAVAVVGADLAVSLTRHAAVVPSFRTYALNGGLSVRPGLSLRWTF